MPASFGTSITRLLVVHRECVQATDSALLSHRVETTKNPYLIVSSLILGLNFILFEKLIAFLVKACRINFTNCFYSNQSSE